MSPLERALDELYESEPAEFTKKRDALVKDLKKAGDKESAAFLAARRKPTQIAYVLNQLARQHPDAVAELVDVGRELAREQRRALRGEASHGLRDSIDRQRKAIAEVGQKAASVMKSLGLDPMAHLQEVTVALQAALIDPTIGAQLEAGQLEKAPEAAVGGFGAAPLADTESTRELERSVAARKKKSSRPPPKDEDEDDKAEKEKERRRAAHAEKVEEAKAVLAAAEKEAKKLHAEAARARSDSEEAEAAFKKARAAADEASREARRLASEATAADRTVAAAEKELAQLEKSAP